MLRKILTILLWLLLALAAFMAFNTWRNWEIIQRVFLGGVKVYETTPPALPADIKHSAVLVFSKTNGFRHEEAIPAANALFRDLAAKNGWGYFQTENGAAFTPQILAHFDAVIFNNVSGGVLTLEQRGAFKAFIENGGGFVGIHAAGDNSHKGWPWYQDEMIGARFTAHTMAPQFQTATLHVEDAAHSVMKGLPANWQHLEEWYSFEKSPRSKGYGVLATVDEKTYNPEGMLWKDLHMGDHPVIWWHCQRKGRVFYSALGHRAQAYSNPEYRRILANATAWVLHLTGDHCDGGPAKTGTKP